MFEPSTSTVEELKVYRCLTTFGDVVVMVKVTGSPVTAVFGQTVWV